MVEMETMAETITGTVETMEMAEMVEMETTATTAMEAVSVSGITLLATPIYHHTTTTLTRILP